MIGLAIGSGGLVMALIVHLWSKAKTEARWERLIEEIREERSEEHKAADIQRRDRLARNQKIQEQRQARSQRIQEQRIAEARAATEQVEAIKAIRIDLAEIRRDHAAAMSRVAAAEAKADTVVIEQAHHRTLHHDHWAPVLERFDRCILEQDQRLRVLEMTAGIAPPRGRTT